jgi:SAM-dependent methyltransferase
MSDDDPNAVEARELESWEASASLYADVLGFATAHGGQHELAVDLGQISSTSRVLDVGCGPGQLTALLAGVAASVTGIDFSPGMIAEARERYPDIEFHVANTEQLSFEDHRFDVVVCSYVAHHLARPLAAFRELHRVIAPGGRLVVITPIQEGQISLGVLMQALSEVLPDQQNREMFPSGPLDGAQDPGEHVRVLQEAGFVNVIGEDRTKPLVQSDLSVLRNSLWHLAGLTEQPADVQDQVRQRIAELSQGFRPSDGSYTFPDRVITCIAHRGP